MALPTAEVATQRWADRLSGARSAYVTGIEAVTENPMLKAANSADLWLMRLQESKDKYIKSLKNVSFDTWKKNSTDIGASRLVSGAEKGRPKFLEFMSRFLPHLATGVKKVQAMPKGSLEQSAARMTAMMRHNASFAGRK